MINIDRLQYVGSELHRPECVLATADGTLHVSDWRGGVTMIAADGTQTSVLAQGAYSPKPNGIAIHPEGGWLLAHLGDTDGGVYRLFADGRLVPFLLEVEGHPLPPTNYVHIDDLGRVWVTFSTRRNPRSLGYRPDCDDGFIVLVDREGARVVADGLGYPNECLIHPETRQLFVNETFARRLLLFDVDEDGSLSQRTVLAEFGHGTYPDGLTFDANGGTWITSIVSNRVIRTDANGQQDLVLEDVDHAKLDAVETAFHSGEMGRSHLSQPYGCQLKNISSAAFGGPDLRTVFLGCLLGDSIARFRSGVPGLRPFHWHWDAFRPTAPSERF